MLFVRPVDAVDTASLSTFDSEDAVEDGELNNKSWSWSGCACGCCWNAGFKSVCVFVLAGGTRAVVVLAGGTRAVVVLAGGTRAVVVLAGNASPEARALVDNGLVKVLADVDAGSD